MRLEDYGESDLACDADCIIQGHSNRTSRRRNAELLKDALTLSFRERTGLSQLKQSGGDLCDGPSCRPLFSPSRSPRESPQRAFRRRETRNAKRSKLIEFS